MLFKKIEKFAKKFGVPVFNSNSQFPNYYATHSIDHVDVLNKEYLFSSKLLGKKGLSCEIDRYLGATNYVFFALGKGYLKSKKSVGLIYDPFVLAKSKGANLVMNDLLYVLGDTDILHNYCDKNIDKLLKILETNYRKLKGNKPKAAILKIFTTHLALQKNLLVAGTKEEFICGNAFELILKLLPKKEELELKRILAEKIVTPNTINKQLGSKIKEIFHTQQDFLDKFFGEIKEERMIELRVPNKHRITNGLIGIYNT